jgi:hypothetical protein
VELQAADGKAQLQQGAAGAAAAAAAAANSGSGSKQQPGPCSSSTHMKYNSMKPYRTPTPAPILKQRTTNTHSSTAVQPAVQQAVRT